MEKNRGSDHSVQVILQANFKNLLYVLFIRRGLWMDLIDVFIFVKKILSARIRTFFQYVYPSDSRQAERIFNA
jgi:hypothetical protein